MRNFRDLSTAIRVCVLTLVTIPNVQAHLMQAQHGTLNIVDDGAYMVLSLPVSTFEHLDDNGDSKVSMIEFNLHRNTIISAVRTHIMLRDTHGETELEGVMLSPVLTHGAQADDITQLTVLGRFALNEPNQSLHFHVGLFGTTHDERLINMTASRQADNKKAKFELSPDNTDASFFIDNR